MRIPEFLKGKKYDEACTGLSKELYSLLPDSSPNINKVNFTDKESRVKVKPLKD